MAVGTRGQGRAPKLRRSAVNQAAADKEREDYDKVIETIKDKRVTRRAKRQFQSGWGELRHRVVNARPYQWAIGVFAVFLTVWAVFATYILMEFSVHYLFTHVESNRKGYIVDSAMALAQSQAAGALLTAHHVRDAICVGVTSGIIQGSNSYAAIERVVAPALLAGPFLSTIEMSFSDSPDLMVVGHKLATDGRFLVTMQSSTSECFLLGVEGCVDPPGLPGERPEWFSRYDSLPIQDASGYGTNGGAEDARGSVLVKSGWEDAPELIPTQHAIDGTATAWAPSYRLGFRCGTSLEVAGRVALQLGGLSGGWFNDSRLGEKGQFYLVDRFGTVLASHTPAELLVVEAGQIRFARVWELRGRGWAPELRSAFSGPGNVTDMDALHGGEVQIALRQLPPPFDHFALVVVALDTSPFVSMPLYVSSVVSMAIALAPWIVALAVGSVRFTRGWRKNSELRALSVSSDVMKLPEERERRSFSLRETSRG